MDPNVFIDSLQKTNFEKVSLGLLKDASIDCLRVDMERVNKAESPQEHDRWAVKVNQKIYVTCNEQYIELLLEDTDEEPAKDTNEELAEDTSLIF
ncbi:unnamed protein product [Adineta steineri]|uniref:Uncharacterized protein n=1 Tax=Adineta steineri TaxID=433720 RepID=A0A816DFZ9_9BILA|nr:unnamed protein product [Adineta steineri]CAF1637852.1 unnamed protein product [Adineta steineri]